MMLSDFPGGFEAVVIGASGGIGQAIVAELCAVPAVARIHCFTRGGLKIQHEKVVSRAIDLESEDSIEQAAQDITDKVRLIIIASGFLHDADIRPEKSLKDIDLKNLETNFKINCFGPALIFKHFLPKLPRDGKSVVAALSARVGSISDNRLGGWYSYRASKAALNMMIKTSSIEMSRKWKHAIVIGLHPGTVNTPLSEPFQNNVPDEKLFDAQDAAQYLLRVIDRASVADTGLIFDWQGRVIDP
tara:strand:+ start:2988 stop:3722 length:735 start_codon:yes stop_codon:yes gene_type:complete